MASLVKVDPALFAKYSWRGRTIEYHRPQIRKAYGTRPPTEADEDRWARWLAAEMCPTEISQDRLAAAVRQRCRSEKVAQREFIAFWLAEGRVLVGMNANVGRQRGNPGSRARRPDRGRGQARRPGRAARGVPRRLSRRGRLVGLEPG
jgi:Domain of unknown function (DUF4158)